MEAPEATTSGVVGLGLSPVEGDSGTRCCEANRDPSGRAEAEAEIRTTSGRRRWAAVENTTKGANRTSKVPDATRNRSARPNPPLSSGGAGGGAVHVREPTRRSEVCASVVDTAPTSSGRGSTPPPWERAPTRPTPKAISKRVPKPIGAAASRNWRRRNRGREAPGPAPGLW